MATKTRAARLAERLDPYMTGLGLLWLALWTIEPLVGETNRAQASMMELAQNAIWVVFVVEFATRLVVAPRKSEFLKRQWWELIILLLPVLRFLRIVRLLRVARAGRAVTSAVGAARSAERRLANRLATLAVVTGIIIVVSGRLLYDFGEVKPYGHAMRTATLSAIHGDQIAEPTGVADAIEIILIVYSVLVVATLAGSLGAFFVAPKRPDSAGA